jgi:hypothetical protein
MLGEKSRAWMPGLLPEAVDDRYTQCLRISGLVLSILHADAIADNESHVCDVALSPTRAKGHVAERRAAAPRSPRHPEGVPMYIRAVICSCAITLGKMK